MADDAATTETDAAEWSPPVVEHSTGVEMLGEFPVNHRLRAEALADAGLAEDPNDIVSPELIADASARLEADRKAHPPVSPTMPVKKIEQIAKAEKVDLSPASNNVERVALIQTARGVAPVDENKDS